MKIKEIKKVVEIFKQLEVKDVCIERFPEKTLLMGRNEECFAHVVSGGGRRDRYCVPIDVLGEVILSSGDQVRIRRDWPKILFGVDEMTYPADDLKSDLKMIDLTVTESKTSLNRQDFDWVVSARSHEKSHLQGLRIDGNAVSCDGHRLHLLKDIPGDLWASNKAVEVLSLLDWTQLWISGDFLIGDDWIYQIKKPETELPYPDYTKVIPERCGNLVKVNTKEIQPFLHLRGQHDYIDFRATQGAIILKGVIEKEIEVKTEGCMDFTVSRHYFAHALDCAETVEISQKFKKSQIRVETEKHTAVIMPYMR